MDLEIQSWTSQLLKMIPSGSSGFNINEQTDLNTVKKYIEEDPYNYYQS